MFEMRWMINLVFLLSNTIYDLKYKKIWAKGMFFFIPLIIVSAIVGKPWKMSDWWLAYIPGTIFLFVSWIKPAMIGMGDGICILLLGFLWEWYEVLKVCVLALLLAGVTGVLLLTLKKATGKTQMPFVPFLFVAAVMIGLKG